MPISLTERFWTYIYVLCCSEIIPTAADKTATGLIYTSLVVWMHVQWLRAGYSEVVDYILDMQRVKANVLKTLIHQIEMNCCFF